MPLWLADLIHRVCKQICAIILTLPREAPLRGRIKIKTSLTNLPPKAKEVFLFSSVTHGIIILIYQRMQEKVV